MNKLIKHFLTPDHLAFMGVLIFVVLGLATGERCWLAGAVVCWFVAFLWDVLEEKIKLFKRIERRFKSGE